MISPGSTPTQPSPIEAEGTRWRKQAREWLADLDSWNKKAKPGLPRDMALIREALGHSKTNPDLAGIRDEQPLKALPEDERKALRALWDEVSAVLVRIQTYCQASRPGTLTAPMRLRNWRLARQSGERAFILGARRKLQRRALDHRAYGLAGLCSYPIFARSRFSRRTPLQGE